MFAVLWLTLMAGAGDAVVVDGGACVEQTAVELSVAQRVPAGRPGRIDVSVVDGEPADGVAAEVMFPDGGRRRLTAGDCAQLTEQIAFVIALWRDPSLVLRPAITNPPQPTPPPERTLATPPPAVVEVPTATPVAAPVARVSVAAVAIGLGASSLLAGPQVSVGVRSRGVLWVQGGARFEFSPPQQHGPAVLSLWAPSLTVDGCGSLAFAWACLGVNGGALIAVPHDGLVSPQVGVVPLTTAGLTLGAAVPFTSTSSLFVELGARVPLVPMVVAAGATSLWASPTVTAHASAGVAFDLP